MDINKEFEIINNIIGHEVPEVLFHYTNLGGLHGILTTKEVWLSNLYFLNDKNEFDLGLRLINEEIEFQKIGLQIVDTINIYLKAIIEAVNFIKEKDSPYILSLTKNKDLLSQWRGYTENGVGANIGFKKSFYMKKIFHIFPCIYDEKKQKELIRHIVWTSILIFVGQADARGLMKKSKDGVDKSVYDEPITVAGNYFIYFATIACCLIKDSSFREEEEWRIIYSNSKTQVNFIPQKNYLKPFVKSPLTDINNLIQSITIGPNPEKELCHLSISKLLKSLNLDKIKIDHSTIPYRN